MPHLQAGSWGTAWWPCPSDGARRPWPHRTHSHTSQRSMACRPSPRIGRPSGAMTAGRQQRGNCWFSTQGHTFKETHWAAGFRTNALHWCHAVNWMACGPAWPLLCWSTSVLGRRTCCMQIVSPLWQGAKQTADGCTTAIQHRRRNPTRVCTSRLVLLCRRSQQRSKQHAASERSLHGHNQCGDRLVACHQPHAAVSRPRTLTSGSSRTSSVYLSHSGATRFRSSRWMKKKPPTCMYACSQPPHAMMAHIHACPGIGREGNTCGGGHNIHGHMV